MEEVLSVRDILDDLNDELRTELINTLVDQWTVKEFLSFIDNKMWFDLSDLVMNMIVIEATDDPEFWWEIASYF